MANVKTVDTKNVTINADTKKAGHPAELEESPMTLKWAFKIEGEGRIKFLSLKQIVKRILQAFIQ